MSQAETTRSELVSFHVTEEQKREIRVEAAKRDLSISEYLRRELEL